MDNFKIQSESIFTPVCQLLIRQSIPSPVMLYVRDDVDQKNAHSMMKPSDVPIYVRHLFRVHLAVRTLKSRPLAAIVAHVFV